MHKTSWSRLPSGKDFAFWEDSTVYDFELHVHASHPQASDENTGDLQHPLLTINAAAAQAKPGTRVVIHEGVYRETVRPAQGGTGPDRMISYECAKGDSVIIKASEVAESFAHSTGWRLTASPYEEAPEGVVIWQTKLNPEQFKGYNPFCAVNMLHDRLFIEYDKTDMTTYLNRRGMVFCDGKALTQVPLYNQMAALPGSYWVEANGQTVHFRLENDENPANHCIELTCREQCFAPDKPFLSYIRVKGLTCAHAATGAPVPQRGAISAFRGHHWIIEDCTIDWANGVGIDIGNECWHHTHDADRLLGCDIIRRCSIYNVGVCAIAAMFVQDILVEDNLIQGTGWQKMELSWEAGGLKAHNCKNSLFRRNIFTKTIRADHLWLDVANENNRIVSNLFLDGIEQREAIFIECSRDSENLIDHNVFWNIEGRFDKTQVKNEPGSSGWYKLEEDGIVNGYGIYGEGTDHLRIAHNLFGKCRSAGYFAKPVPFRIGYKERGGTSRDAQVYGNIFYDCGEAALKFPTEKNQSDGNLFAQMPGGFLRILYPAPEACLDLKAWQEFYGLDVHSAEGELELHVDTDAFTVTVSKFSGALPIPADYLPYGVCGPVPGPFDSLDAGLTCKIDPRNI